MGSNLNNVEFRAEKARLLTKPRYAWVINFVDGEKIAIENVVLGHTEEGYCRGGVLRFENCKDVLVADTDLFGSGTYGLELVNCINVHFDNCTIRKCSYGILRVRDCSGLMFAQCRFEKNRQFDLVESAGRYRDVSFVECYFRSNYSQEHLFYFEDDCDASIDFAHCRIVRNKAISLTNREASVLFANSVVSDNAFSG